MDETLAMFGMRIIESPNLIIPTGREDWSRVRSPGRARRRRHKHRQNIRPEMKPDPNFYVDKINGVIICHPEMARALYAKMKPVEKPKAPPPFRMGGSPGIFQFWPT